MLRCGVPSRSVLLRDSLVRMLYDLYDVYDLYDSRTSVFLIQELKTENLFRKSVRMR